MDMQTGDLAEELFVIPGTRESDEGLGLGEEEEGKKKRDPVAFNNNRFNEEVMKESTPLNVPSIIENLAEPLFLYVSKDFPIGKILLSNAHAQNAP